MYTKPIHYICFPHHERRKILFAEQGIPHCRICGEPMIFIGRTLKIPKKDDMKAWECFEQRVRRYFKIHGWEFPERNPKYPNYEPKEKTPKLKPRKPRQTHRSRRDRSYH